MPRKGKFVRCLVEESGTSQPRGYEVRKFNEKTGIRIMHARATGLVGGTGAKLNRDHVFAGENPSSRGTCKDRGPALREFITGTRGVLLIFGLSSKNVGV